MTFEQKIKAQLAELVWQALALSEQVEQKDKEIADLKKQIEDQKPTKK